MPTPFLWMANYNKDLDECDLNITYSYLIYIISFNVLFEFLPMLLLTYLYISIIRNTKKNYSLFKNMFSLAKIRTKTIQTSHTQLSIQSSVLNHNRTKKVVTFVSEHLSTSVDQETNLHSEVLIEKDFNSEYMAKRSISTSKSSADFSNSKYNRNNKKFIKRFIETTSVSSVSSSLASMDIYLRRRAKGKYKSAVQISILTILSFWCQIPIRLFICWSYLNSYFSKFGNNYYENFIEKNYEIIIVCYNVFSLIYFLNIIFNCIIYNIYSDDFRKALKRFFGII